LSIMQELEAQSFELTTDPGAVTMSDQPGANPKSRMIGLGLGR